MTLRINMFVIVLSHAFGVTKFWQCLLENVELDLGGKFGQASLRNAGQTPYDGGKNQVIFQKIYLSKVT